MPFSEENEVLEDNGPDFFCEFKTIPYIADNSQMLEGKS